MSNIPDRTWWSECPLVLNSSASLVEYSNKQSRKLEMKLNKVKNEGELELYRCIFVYETLRDERNIPDSITLDDVCNVLERQTNGKSARNVFELKIMNLGNAYLSLFENVAQGHVRMDLSLIFDVHEKVMQGLIPHPGHVRKKDAKPAQSDYFYLSPQWITRELTQLCCLTNYKLSKAETCEDILLISAAFCSNMLQTHPFSNGNGRTSRLLTSFILREMYPLPICIFGSNHHAFFLCMEDCNADNYSSAETLARLILENTCRSIDLMSFLICE